MKTISPIAIDMGAKNTGVYYANYKQGSSFDEIDKKGEVLIYEEYTALLRDRTAKRHARRGYQRKKLAKRLVTLVLESYFHFPAGEHSQAIGFLLNRRGFTRIEEEYSPEHLQNMPGEAWDALFEEVQQLLGNKKDGIDKIIEQLTNDEPKKITEIFKAIQEIEGYKNFQETKDEIKKDYVYFDYVEKIGKAFDIVKKGRDITDEKMRKTAKDTQNLSETSKWIVGRLQENELDFITDTGNQTNLITQINKISNIKQLKNKLPDIEKEREKIKKREKENNNSDWNFKIAEFEFNHKNEKGLEEDKPKTHLHHFCYAIYQINHALTTGHRHRSTFFEEIKSDLLKADKHSHEYLKNFIKDIKDNQKLDINKLHKAVCHISNLELKPLRAYFNDSSPIQRKKEYRKTDRTKSNFVSHKNGGDEFSNEKLSRVSSTWFLKHWTVNKEKDTSKKVTDHKELKQLWEQHQDKDDVVAFWLETDPTLTIPPYQSMTNRKPPKCQSLVLNGEYLDKHYPNWKDWIASLNPDKGYKEKMQSLQSRKGKRERKGKPIDGRLVSDELISLRQLQFVLDTAKKIDNYKLNEIWSAHHKIQQLQKDNTKDSAEIKIWKGKLKKIKEESQLPNKLKQDLDFDKQDSFGHFINKYYKNRRKAKDGRYFLIQEKKEKWLTDGRLLILCQHKPKQKKYQWLLDLSAILGVDSKKLGNKIRGKDPEDWLKEISGFKSACAASAKAQKDHRGGLKTQIDREFRKKKGNLYELNDKCEKLAIKLSALVFDDLSKDDQSKKAKKFKSIFSFAQIDNIVFKDRNGFSKTCPVCSTDNAFRMNEVDGFAQAQRLPALSIRLIDGVVMRICDAVSRHVAVVCWKQYIGHDVDEGAEVNIPLILEQNRFEFEPNLAKLKGKKTNKDDMRSDYADKVERIKTDAKNICAYSGDDLGDCGEIDHIIPQASVYGTLNDEANLIYVSERANKEKRNKEKFLADLNDEYKQKIFNCTIDDEIKEFIYQQLEGENAGEVDVDARFCFGAYLSFINLDEKQKIAFRHALFLKDDPLKRKVINALQNRNRTIVNGTQRYMAQCIADKIYKIAKQAGKEKQVSFDYFEYSATAHNSNSTVNLRKFYEDKDAKLPDGTPLADLAKKPGTQKLQSHLIDAQMAFLLAADEHKNNGTMGLYFGKGETVTQGVDMETGEYKPNKFFELSCVEEKNIEVELNAKSMNKKIMENSNTDKKINMSKIFQRYVFKQNAIGERYKPIVEFEEKLYLGYPQKIKGGAYTCRSPECNLVKKTNKNQFKQIIENEKYYELTTDTAQIKIYTIKKINKQYKVIDLDSHTYFSKVNKKFTVSEKADIKHINLINGECKYYVKRDDVIHAPKIVKEERYKQYPFYKNWVDFDAAWKKIAGGQYKLSAKGDSYILETDSVKEKWNEFCRQQLHIPKEKKNKHAKVRKTFSMIALGTPSGTVFRMNRQGKHIYQAVPLDMNVISKNRSNFLIKHSKNLTLVSKKADTDLSADINIKEEFELKNQKIKTDQFFEDAVNLEGVEVYLNSTSVDVKMFPLDKFKEYLSGNETIKLLTEEGTANNPTLLYADKSKVDHSIRCTTRDNSIKNIEITDKSVNFSLPFRSANIKKFLTKLK